ncbi:hypothetical protein [Nonomuraea sp. SBT364]|uniref:hypothetical protein n=1 Tax=Nonomuraea sp. SBT364 TaxID=1580530 RepID=UPI00066CC04D|nr:hypothetical protein [Nonomuraea sp. SBT364]
MEIGAGTGLIAEVFAAAAEAERPGRLERVTVLPYGALDVDVGEPVAAGLIPGEGPGGPDVWRLAK